MMDDATLLGRVGGRYALILLPVVAGRTLKGGCVHTGLLQPGGYTNESLPVS